MTGDRFSNQIRRYRLREGHRVKDLAFLIGHKSSSHVSRYESGRRIPSLRTGFRLSIALGCPTEVLFFGLFSELRDQVVERKRQLIAARAGSAKAGGPE